METSKIKNRIRDNIEHGNERILRIINAIIETEEKEVPQLPKEILDERWKHHQENPEEGKTWEEVKSVLQKKYGV
ncbi:addiction module protein [Zunongwangia sp. F260]|uniref:Addiction module protein n=1 Tax=Autumnicola lenta TaxID=3075593 RepID=A0ABU3CG48_9FLAO|nr:addiction module protein [Zunongwangia sp. F260]MDT0645333.1 addiction module protein [Zunongwangia sp. F260]